MSQTMKLSSEEIALIEQKRAEEKAKQDELLKSYDSYKESTIASENKRLSNLMSNAEILKSRYETMYNELIEVSKDFKLVCVKNNLTFEVKLFEVDENGFTIRYITDENGERIYLDPKEIVNLEYYSYTLRLDYTGNVPNGFEYYVIPIVQYSKYSKTEIGYKMQIQGTNINSWDKRGQMTKAKSVHNKIIELVDSEFLRIEYINRDKSESIRIEQRFKIEFSKYSKNYIKEKNTFTIKLENGINVTIYGFEDREKNIGFNFQKFYFPNGQIEIRNLLDGLNSIKGKL